MCVELPSDSPLEHYKYHFPNDREAEETVKSLMLKAASKYHNIEYTNLEQPQLKGLGILEIEVLTLFEIEDLVGIPI